MVNLAMIVTPVIAMSIQSADIDWCHPTWTLVQKTGCHVRGLLKGLIRHGDSGQGVL